MRKNIILALALLLALPLVADEGMWLFNHPPRQILKRRYGFDPSQAWLDHLQKASVRFNSGGSCSFVSASGLILTNHHVGLDCLQKISTAKHDYVATGYHAKTAAEEVKCVDLELNVLQSIEDVTGRVNGAVTSGMSSADSQRSLENERRAHDDLFGIKNSRKAYIGRIAGLQDPAIMQKKIDAEAVLR